MFSRCGIRFGGRKLVVLALLGCIGPLLIPLSASEARADFIADPNCTGLTQSGPAPKFDTAYFNSLTAVSASSDGATGVFFLTAPSGTLVVKFEDRVNFGAVASRRILTGLNVPSDTLIADYTDATKIKNIFNGLDKAVTARPNLVSANRRPRYDSLRNALEQKFSGQAGKIPPQHIIVTAFLKGYAGASNLGQAIQRPEQNADTTKELLQLAGAIKALGNARNQRFLGYLYVVDILMGNNDRFQRTPANWGNVFIAEGANGAACLVAIDNEAHAPDTKYMAMARYIYKARNAEAFLKPDQPIVSDAGQLVFKSASNAATAKQVKFQTTDLSRDYAVKELKKLIKAGTPPGSRGAIEPSAGGTNTNPSSIEGNAQKLTALEYFNEINISYKDLSASVNPEFYGPMSILKGDYFSIIFGGDMPQKDLRSDPDTCQELSEAVGPGSILPWIRRHLRTELTVFISAKLNLAQRKGVPVDNSLLGARGEFTTKAVSVDTLGSPLLVPANADFYSYSKVCKTSVEIEPNQIQRQIISAEVDWSAFDQNFIAGAQAAMTDIRNKDAMNSLFEAALKGAPKLKTLDVSIEGLQARADFLAEYAAGIPIDQIYNALLAENPEPSYMTPTQLPAMTYKYLRIKGKSMWVPQ